MGPKRACFPFGERSRRGCRRNTETGKQSLSQRFALPAPFAQGGHVRCSFAAANGKSSTFVFPQAQFTTCQNRGYFFYIFNLKSVSMPATIFRCTFVNCEIFLSENSPHLIVHLNTVCYGGFCNKTTQRIMEIEISKSFHSSFIDAFPCMDQYISAIFCFPRSEFIFF